MLKNGICILLVFYKKMIVRYKLNCFFIRKFYRDYIEGNKNIKVIFFMKERREFLFNNYLRM